VGRTALAQPAPDACPGRETVRRLRRPDGADHRPDERRDPAAAIFVAVLGASNYTYSEATWSQSLPDWIGSHARTFEHLGGVTALVVPDNLKSGVTTACYYEPELNPTYRDLATHYGTAVLPARPRRPKDKAKAEAGVLLVERWVLARLRHQRFFSLSELNHSIAELMSWLNQRPFKKLPGCRQSAFVELDRPALLPLPVTRYEFAEWKVVRVGIDYHVELVGHYYSVPYRFAREQVDSRLTASTVELFHRGTRIASHVRNDSRGRHSTVDAHMAPAHQAVQGWNAPRLLDWAGRIGPHAKAWCRAFCISAAIRNRPTGRAWASCAWARPTGTTAWKRPASGPSPLGRRPTAA
jgi:transposase